MHPEKQDQLFRFHADLFDGPARACGESAMDRSFECGEGWFGLIDAFCAAVRQSVATDAMPAVEIVHKEKFGSLRIRFRGGDERTRAVAEVVRIASLRVCEETGVPREPDPHAE